MKHRSLVIIGPLVVALIAITYGTLRHQTNTNQPTAVKPARGSMVALGDSVAAGIGLTPYSDASACDRTDQAYPRLVASHTGFSLDSLACSGATITSGIAASQTVNDLALTSQLDRLFAAPKPALITLTIGANDLGWTQLIGECITATCATPNDDAVVSGRLAAVATNLQASLEQIKNHYGSSTPRVVVTGYYGLYSAPLVSCSDTTGIDTTEAAWINTQLGRLNETIIQAVAQYSFARYAAISFSGHELCSTTSWIQGLGEVAPYHPTAAGQAAIATSVEAAAKS